MCSVSNTRLISLGNSLQWDVMNCSTLYPQYKWKLLDIFKGWANDLWCKQDQNRQCSRLSCSLQPVIIGLPKSEFRAVSNMLLNRGVKCDREARIVWCCLGRVRHEGWLWGVVWHCLTTHGLVLQCTHTRPPVHWESAFAWIKASRSKAQWLKQPRVKHR